MKTKAFNYSILLFVSFLLFSSGCKKETPDPYPVGDLKFSLFVTDSSGKEKTRFAEGEDIFFEVHEINPLNKDIVYHREAAIKTDNFIVFNEAGFVGDLKDTGINIIFIYVIERLKPNQHSKVIGHWLGKNSNTALPKGKYTVRYHTDVTLLPGDYGDDDRKYLNVILKKEFTVE